MAVGRMRVIFDLTDHEIKPRYVDGRELPGWEKGPGMVDYVKQLESEGWRVVGGKGNSVILERDAH